LSIISKLTNSWAQADDDAKRLAVKYAILTAALFLPLFWAFLAVRNLYPIAAWNVMMAGGDLERGRSYCILRGETVFEDGDVAAVARGRMIGSRS